MAIFSVDTDGNGDYSSLNSFMSDVGVGVESDLAIAGGHVVNYSGSADDTIPVDISTQFTNASATNYLDIVGDYNVRLNTSGSQTLTTNLSYLRLRRFKMRHSSSNSSDELIRFNAGIIDPILDQMHLEIRSNASSQDLIYAGNWSVTNVTIRNSILFVNVGDNGGRAVVHAQNYAGSSAQTWKLQNCLIVGAGMSACVRTDVSSGSTVVDVENCYALNAVTDYDSSGGGSISLTTSASSDTTGSSGLQNPRTTDQFVDFANGDYHLKSGSDLINAGADLSAYFTTDFDNVTRVLPFDIGPYELIGGAGPSISIPVIMNYYAQKRAS